MPTTLTLKNIPDALYESLKASAEQHRRSLNSEAIVCLESVLLSGALSVQDRLSRARQLRASLGAIKMHEADIKAFKREGRENCR